MDAPLIEKGREEKARLQVERIQETLSVAQSAIT